MTGTPCVAGDLLHKDGEGCGSTCGTSTEAFHMKRISLFLFASLIVYATFFTEKARLDSEVKRLCAIDGGIKVYEMVKLPVERFDQYGQIQIPAEWLAKPEDEYFYKGSTSYLIKGNPELLQLRTLMYRKSDNKLLGESTVYMRHGDGMPGPWYMPAFICPQKTDVDMKEQIFIKE